MTIYNQFTNLNMDYLSNGINTQTSWFSPTLPFAGWSGFNSFNSFNFNTFTSLFFNALPMPSFSFDFSKLFPTDIWDNVSWNNDSAWSGWGNSSIWNNTSRFNSTNAVWGDSFTLSNKNKKGFSVAEYNAESGEKLAKIALRNSKGFSGYCATYVKRAIEKAGLGAYQQGDAYQMTSILRGNENFKEISPSSVNVEDLPAGCVIVYNKGSQGYSAKYGHTEITTGDNRAVSDGITKNLNKQPDAIFVPVRA